MRTSDNDCNTVIIDDAPVNPLTLRFADVLGAVDEAPGLKRGVRQNIRNAVIRTADLMSPLLLNGPVDIPAIAKKLEKLVPVQLGFRHPGSMPAYKSNLRRALKLAGAKVMPG